ncbi:MAG: chemotaxis protein [Bradyrhizobiaceae bacterium]|nr:MAG: chemotaxis protein [Bradyrhizobiaceae bacterium]
MNHFIGIIIESLVAVLLLFTIGYCRLLNTRLKALKADEQSLKATIAELITATEIAERAIGGLKLTVRECDETLGSQLAAASDLSGTLGKQVSVGTDILKRLCDIAIAARAQQAEQIVAAPVRASGAKAIVAAAQAFSERQRAGVAA